MRTLALITLVSMTAPAFAGDLTTGIALGTTMADVKTRLVEMGYEVRKAEMDDGKIEVYFVKDGQMGEADVSPETGKITKLEMK